MNHIEFSSEFDILYNNIMSNAAPGLNEYEKSVFLTQAQEQTVIEAYTGDNNNSSFERTEEVRRYLSELVKTYITDTKESGTGLSTNSVFFKIPDDIWYVTYESVKLLDDNLGCKNGSEALVFPTTQDDYWRLSKNPFRGPSDSRVLRLDNNSNIIELISKYNINTYLIRYLVQPSPIILDDLSSYDMTINGVSEITECKLNPVLHRVILTRAVTLAKLAYIGKE